MIKKLDFDIDGIINDYINEGMGVVPICKKYHLGKLKVKAVLAANGIEMKKKGKQPLSDDFVVKDFKQQKYKEHDGFHYEAIDKNNGYTTLDYMNSGGHLTTHIKNTYGIAIPTLYDRRLYYMRTGNYWWEQWFNIVEVKNKETKKCPYCNWETEDIENRSGMFETHLKQKHNITKKEYLKEHQEDIEYFRVVNKTLDRQLEIDESKFVTCAICGKKFARITNEHLRKHNITKLEYLEKYGGKTLSSVYYDFLSKNMHKINENMSPHFISKAENEISEFITKHGFECVQGDRKILKGKELDIYIPSLHLAIEYNGNLWHGEKNGKTVNSHVEKTNLCNSLGIGLIQIFEDEYVLRKDIVYSKLSQILGINKDNPKIPARKCSVREIHRNDAEVFLEQNHIQGFVNSTLYLGCFYNDMIVGVMSFLMEGENWNLTRFATAQGYICQGVGGKLFKYFVRNYNPLLIKSFADRRWTIDGTDNLYTKLGFELEETLKPDYRYYNPKVDRVQRFHKFGFRKEKLHKKYGLPIEMTELEMAKELGYDRIWDCGLFKYIWRKEQ